MPSRGRTNNFARQVLNVWDSPRISELRAAVGKWQKTPFSGTEVLIVGSVIATLIIMIVDRNTVLLPNPGLVYVPLVAFLAYYWNWRYGLIAILIQLLCVYFFFTPPEDALKPLTTVSVIQLVTL